LFPKELLKAAQEWAEELAARSVSAIGLTKNVLRHALEKDLHDSIEYEFRIQQFLVGKSDNMEAIAAFFEKRTAVFSGH